ncbi:phosphoribosylformylglycinamidine synthase subunit PurQ [Truepera radiovictrix]|nr:phosphoribosylformylglycinamidine synthase subunit PurQ [Truepera radiovictrix]
MTAATTAPTAPKPRPAAAFRVAVVRFPGSNCDEDTCFALEHLGFGVRRVWHTDTDLKGSDAVVLPGGFSYGDYLRSGAMAALSPVMSEVARFAARGGPVLGICNGFQLLTEARLLPGALARNTGLHFVCRRAFVRVERADTPFTNAYRAGQVLALPVAHGEGRFVADVPTLERLEGEGRVVFRYATPAGEVTAEANPNGSLNAIAGVTNERGNVLGLMPHPERAVEALLGSEDGVGVFASLLSALAGAA